jgi:hypothetical protein
MAAETPDDAGMTGDLLLGLLAGLALGALHLLWLRRASARLGAGAGTGACSPGLHCDWLSCWRALLPLRGRRCSRVWP